MRTISIIMYECMEEHPIGEIFTRMAGINFRLPVRIILDQKQI